MPTITLTTSPLSASTKRLIATRLTRWFAAAGVAPAHVVLRFADAPPGTLFSGGIPVELIPQGESELQHASVVVQLGPQRDDAFRDALGAEIVGALDLRPDTPFLYVEFRTTSPGDVRIARRGQLVRADGQNTTEGATTMTTEASLDLPARVRQTLAGFLGDRVENLDQDADLSTALGDRYDSLGALECVSSIEREFGIEVDYVTHDVRHWFSTLGRIEEFVANELEDQSQLSLGV